MVVSAAIGEFAEILAHLEQTNKEVRSVALSETESDAETVTARVRVGIPVIDGGNVSDEVTVRATETGVSDGLVDVTLEFSIPATGDEMEFGTAASRSLSGAVTSPEECNPSDGTPPYKDPDVLEKVYERHDSFPKMTEALGVDVTSETVRRYMVKHGIHDPDEPDEPDGSGDDGNDSASGTAVETGRDGPVESSEKSATGSSNDDGAPQSGRREDTDPSDDGSEHAAYGERSVAEILADANVAEEESLVADGVGVPRNLTVRDLTAILNRSRTVSEASRELDLDHEQTRRMLHELGVISFVTGRLTNSRGEIAVSEVERCIRNAEPPVP